MANSMSGVQWDWSDVGHDVATAGSTVGSDVDSVLYYFEPGPNNMNGNNQRPTA
jgi:hypothetical protein